MLKFALRKDSDTENPILARFYGDGLTRGRVTVYDKIGTRTAFLALIAQGARFQGDTGCAKINRVIYAGFDIPEFDAAGARNWKFHKGYQSKHPVYRRVTFSTSTNLVNDTATPLANGQKVAFHKRGASQIIPTGILTDHQYDVINKTTNSYQIAEVGTTTPIVFDVNSTGTEIFAYRADDAGLFDVDQGQPFFFPNLGFTFSGKSYLEVLLPPELSNGEDEPTRLYIKARGKEVYDVIVGSDSYLDTTGTPLDLEDPALIAYDILKNDIRADRDRFNGQSFVDWKTRSAALIPWAGGNANPAVPYDWAVLSGATYPNASGVLTSTLATNSYGKAVSRSFTDRDAYIEGVYSGGLLKLQFTSDSGGTTVLHGLSVDTDLVTLIFTDGAHTARLGAVAASDRLRIAYENGVIAIYQNGVSIPLDSVGFVLSTQSTSAIYEAILIGTNGKTLSDIHVLPAGTAANPRSVRRFYGDFVSPQLLPASAAFEALIALCPGTAWQDVDGEVTILPDPNRDPVFTFYYDPATTTPNNTSKVKLKNVEEPPNYWRFSYRNKDDAVFKKAYTNADRPLLRAANGGKKREGGIEDYGILTPSQIDRIAESTARISADSPYGFDIEAFLDALIVAKGDYVNVVDPVGGFDDANPSLQIVIEETLEIPDDDVEIRTFETRAITKDWYSDTSHGAVAPATHIFASDRFKPAPVLDALDLSETSRRLPDGTYIPIIDALATFDQSMFGQYGRVFVKSNLGTGYTITSDGSITFTIVNTATFPYANDDPVSMLALTPTTGALPAGIAFDDQLYIKNLNLGAGTFQLARTVGGTAIDPTSSGTGTLALFDFIAWRETGQRISPDPDTQQVGFEIDSIQAGYHYVRVLTVSPGGISYGFSLQKTSSIQVFGDETIPDPPPRVEFTYDGINIRWSWLPSPSPSVAGYIVKDQFGNILYQGDSRTFTMPGRTSGFAIRVFSYSHSSVVSTGYAVAVFNLGPDAHWKNVTGAVVDEQGNIVKTAGSGNNAGAILDWGILTSLVEARISYVIDATNKLRSFGLSITKNPVSVNDLIWGLELNADGTLNARYLSNAGVNTSVANVGSCQIGDRLELRFAAGDPGAKDLSRVDVVRLRYYGADLKQETLYTFPNSIKHRHPAYAAVALFDPASQFSSSFNVAGDLIPVDGVVVTAASITNATLNSTTGTYTQTAASSGMKSADTILAYQDGMYGFSVDAGATFYLGLNSTAASLNFATTPFMLKFNTDNTVAAYKNGSLLSASVGTNGAGVTWSISRENGYIIIRRNSLFVFAFDDTDSNAYVATDLILHVLNNATSGSITNLRFYDAWVTISDSITGRPMTSTGAVIERGQLARNYAYDIPEFALSNPVAGQSLVLDSQLRVTNSAAGSATLADGDYGDIVVSASGTAINIDTNAVVTTKINALAVTTAKINDLAVTTIKVNDLAITSAKLADNAVTTAKINDLTVTTAKVNDLAITSGKLADNSVITAKINDLAVQTAKLDNLAVTNGKIADATIGFGKIATSAWSDDTTLASDSSVAFPTIHAVKSYVDTQVTGLKFKQDVRAATTANITLSGTQTIDGIFVNVGDRVLVKNQTTGSENGSYLVASGAWTRTSDGDTGPELVNATFPVRSGTTNQDTWWTVINDTITIGSTAIIFTLTGGAGTYTAGAGLQLTGNSFSIAPLGVVTSMIADAAVTFAKTQSIAQNSVIYRKSSGTGPFEATAFTTLQYDVLTRANVVRLREDYSDNLSAAISGIGGFSRILWIDSALVPVTSSFHIPSNIIVYFAQTGSITVSTGNTLTIDSVFPSKVDGERQVFFGVGNVVLTTCGEVDISLWAGPGSGSDDDHAFDQALRSLANGGSLTLGSHIYYISPLTLNTYSNEIRLKGCGNRPDGGAYGGTGVYTYNGTLIAAKSSANSSSGGLIQISGNFRECGLEDLAVSIKDSTSLNAIKVSGSSGTSGLGAYFNKVSVQSSLANSQPLIAVDGTSAQAELVKVHFENCTGIADGSNTNIMYVNSSNSNIKTDTCSWTVSNGGIVYDLLSSGWFGVVQGDERGNAPSYSQTLTADRTVTGTYNSANRTITLSASPASNVFLDYDTGQNIQGGTLASSAVYLSVIDSKTAIVEGISGASSFSSPTVLQIYRVAQSGSLGFAVMRVRGTHDNIYFQGGCDEGFKWFLYYDCGQYDGLISMSKRRMQAPLYLRTGLGIIKLEKCDLFSNCINDEIGSGSCFISIDDCNVERRTLVGLGGTAKGSTKYVARPTLWMMRSGSILTKHLATYDDRRDFSITGLMSYRSYSLLQGAENGTTIPASQNFLRTENIHTTGTRFALSVGTTDINNPSANTLSRSGHLLTHDFMTPSSGDWLARFGVCDSASFNLVYGFGFRRRLADGYFEVGFTQDVVTISGAGTSRINGSYQYDTVTNGKFQYIAGNNKLFWNGSNWLLQAPNDFGTMTSYYIGTGGATPGGASWAIGSGSSPSPSTPVPTVADPVFQLGMAVNGDLKVRDFLTLGIALTLSNGGTGATTANAAFNNLAPAQGSSAGKYLKTDGTNTSWADAALTNGTYGDIIVSGTTFTIANNAITTVKIAANAVDLTTKVTGILPAANGGTGNNLSWPIGAFALGSSGGGGLTASTSVMVYNYSTANVGINAATPARRLTIFDTSAMQLRLGGSDAGSYDLGRDGTQFTIRGNQSTFEVFEFQNASGTSYFHVDVNGIQGTWNGTPLTFSKLATSVWSDDTTLASDSSVAFPTIHAVKSYVDTLVTGLKFKQDVRVATTANISLSGTQTIDGVFVNAGERVLVKNQSSPSTNGVYIVAAGGWSRATDGDTGTELVSSTFPVTSGTVNQDTWWTITNDSISIGSTSITFSQTGGSGTYSAGSGLTLSGNSFSIGASQVTNSMLAGGIAYSKLSLGSSITNSDLAGGITYSKLSLTGAILNSDLAGSIAYSKLSLSGSITNADLAGSITAAKLVKTDITTVGTLTVGTWNADKIAAAYTKWTPVTTGSTTVSLSSSDHGKMIRFVGGNTTVTTPQGSTCVDAETAIRLINLAGTMTLVPFSGNDIYFYYYNQTANTWGGINAGGTGNPVLFPRGCMIELQYAGGNVWCYIGGPVLFP